MTARGIRNHNPGNIRVSNDQWQGLDTPPFDGEFFRFKSAPYGIRAMARILISYQDRRRARDGSRIDTVQEIIDRWAPPSENNTDSYAAHVRQIMGLEPGKTLDVHQYEVMSALVKAIIRHENGSQPYPDAVIDKGLVLAGIEPPPKPSRTMKAGTVAGTATALSMASEYADQFYGLMPVLDRVLEYAPWVLGVAAVAAIGWMIWARIDDRRRGLR